jgi:hypothetical protein
VSVAVSESLHVTLLGLTPRLEQPAWTPIELAALVDALRDPDLSVRYDLRLSTVEVVVTDFLVTPDALRVLDTIDLGRGPA